MPFTLVPLFYMGDLYLSSCKPRVDDSDATSRYTSKSVATEGTCPADYCLEQRDTKACRDRTIAVTTRGNNRTVMVLIVFPAGNAVERVSAPGLQFKRVPGLSAVSRNRQLEVWSAYAFQQETREMVEVRLREAGRTLIQVHAYVLGKGTPQDDPADFLDRAGTLNGCPILRHKA